jgi:hypothetical protein
VYEFTRDDIDLEAIGRRFARMSDEQLERYGRSAAFMVQRSPRETFRVQLQEVRGRSGGAGIRSARQGSAARLYQRNQMT